MLVYLRDGDGIDELRKAHPHSAPFLSSLPTAAVETEPMLVWLITDRSLLPTASLA